MRLTSPIATFVATLLLIVSPVLCLAEETPEMVANPAYTSWAKHKVGTKVLMAQTMNAAGMDMKHEVTQTLLEVTPEKAVVELNIKMNIAGQVREQKRNLDVAAKVEKGKEYAPPGVKGTVKEAGNEKIDVAGKSYDCKVIEFAGEGAQGKSTGKMWRNDEIPGTLVKLDMSFEGQQMKGTMVQTVTGVEEK